MPPYHRIYDLIDGGEYMHAWIREAGESKFFLCSWDNPRGMEFSSFQDADDHLVVLQVIRRFERAYG